MIDERDGMTLLQIACENNRVGCMKYLLEQGADMLMRDKENRHCIRYAAQSGDINIVKFLCYLLTFRLNLHIKVSLIWLCLICLLKIVGV